MERYSIKQGVNQRITLHLCFDVTVLEELELSFYQQGTEVLKKSKADCRMDDTVLSTTLSEADTLKFSPQRFSVSLRGKYPDGGTVAIEDIPFVVRRSSFQEVI